MSDNELWPTVEVEWEGKKYTCNLDFGWAYRLDVKCGVNVLDFGNLTEKAQGPKDYVGYVFAALSEHLPQLTPDLVASKKGKAVVAEGIKIFAAFIATLAPADAQKKSEPVVP